MTDSAHIESLLRWGKEKEFPTKRGPRLLRKGRPTDDFWLAWKTEQAELQAEGISVQQDRDNPSKWWVMWWRELPPQELAKRFKNHEASRATDAEIDIPAPDGCNYMPFQKAGIRYCLQTMGDLPTTNVKGGDANPFRGSEQAGCLIADEMG